MDWGFWLQVAGLTANVLFIPVIRYARTNGARIRQLQENEVLHLQETLTRIEEKLDRHLEWHLTERRK